MTQFESKLKRFIPKTTCDDRLVWQLDRWIKECWPHKKTRSFHLVDCATILGKTLMIDLWVEDYLAIYHRFPNEWHQNDEISLAHSYENSLDNPEITLVLVKISLNEKLRKFYLDVRIVRMKVLILLDSRVNNYFRLHFNDIKKL